jgi:hypothetical protein
MTAPAAIVRRQTPPGRGSSVASVPIQRTIRAGLVKYEKTVSGGASTLTSCSTLLVPLGVAGTASHLRFGAPAPAVGQGVERAHPKSY